MKNLIIRLETEKDYRAAENLAREAFWNVYRPGCAEHYVLHVLRNDPTFVPELDFVMELNGRLIGQVIFMHAEIIADDGRTIPVMTFGPISIHPDVQGRGYGRILLDYALTKAAELGAGAVCMEGKIGFYGKCGFVVASTRKIHYYAESREAEVPYFLMRELKEGYLEGISGVYHTPKGYFVKDADVEVFDRDFPKKQKLKLPGQLWE